MKKHSNSVKISEEPTELTGLNLLVQMQRESLERQVAKSQMEKLAPLVAKLSELQEELLPALDASFRNGKRRNKGVSSEFFARLDRAVFSLSACTKSKTQSERLWGYFTAVDASWPQLHLVEIITRMIYRAKETADEHPFEPFLRIVRAGGESGALASDLVRLIIEYRKGDFKANRTDWDRFSSVLAQVRNRTRTYSSGVALTTRQGLSGPPALLAYAVFMEFVCEYRAWDLKNADRVKLASWAGPLGNLKFAGMLNSFIPSLTEKDGLYYARQQQENARARAAARRSRKYREKNVTHQGGDPRRTA
jgi:hypothetical protein